MAQIISSVVIQETVSKILSGLTQKHREGEEESNAYRNLERLEMAHFRLEAALETSDKWQITHSSLLRWRRKLRHAAQECDETLHKCKKRILEEEQMEHEISESTDIVGIAIKCLELFAPHFNCAVEDMRKELTQLPTQDFSWVPYIYSSMKEHWDNLQILGSQWFRPNPLCCKQHNQHELRRASNLDMAGLRNEFLEPVIEVNLQCQVSLSLCSRQNISLSEDLISLKDSPYLKAGITFAPHGSSEDMLPMNARMVRKEEHCLHTDVTLEQLEEIMLPGAINYFRQNAEAAVYQIIWKSKHGCALIQVEKARMSRQRTSMQTRGISGGDRKRKMLQRQHQELGNRTRMISHLLDIWSAHVPVRLQRLSIDWMKLAAH
ncbi:unnamed protein product [Urochloa decumbens]|uniref:Rx N-terminal domain-containing protein n=1 Tax=Urochloa decumbens TaxID=240449 RepID=A0ABC9FLX9_9POAL